MHFDFSFEQQSLADGVRRILQEFPPVKDAPPHPYAAHEVIGRLGAFGLFGEDGGPCPLGAVDLVAVAMEAGRTIVAAPVAESLAAAIVLGPSIAATLAGGGLVGVAISGAVGKGAPALVPHGGEASLFVLPDGERRWLLAERGQLDIEPAGTMDITADAVRVRLRAGADSAHPATNARPMDDMLQLACLAEIVGAAAAMLDRTVAYIGEREQFGKPVGSNQAVKHMAADCAVAVETMKAAVEYAGWTADAATEDEAVAEEARLALASAASFVGEHGRRVAERCVQMHGGIAFTWDYGLHVPLRRIVLRTATAARPREAREALATHLLDSGG